MGDEYRDYLVVKLATLAHEGLPYLYRTVTIRADTLSLSPASYVRAVQIFDTDFGQFQFPTNNNKRQLGRLGRFHGSKPQNEKSDLTEVLQRLGATTLLVYTKKQLQNYNGETSIQKSDSVDITLPLNSRDVSVFQGQLPNWETQEGSTERLPSQAGAQFVDKLPNFINSAAMPKAFKIRLKTALLSEAFYNTDDTARGYLACYTCQESELDRPVSVRHLGADYKLTMKPRRAALSQLTVLEQLELSSTLSGKL
ncbi:hypothetical protein J6590_018200 [Homalodisca vitripennis]|nr:hypothetical protein J6590_018200 [Homalodisca vitripennis]